MIQDLLERAGDYEALHPGLAEAFAFLRRPDLAELAPGRHDIDGDRVYAMVARGAGRKAVDALLEVHDRYLDIQYVLTGVDDMGWKPRAECRRSATAYDPRADVAFFSDEPEAWLHLRPGRFAVFFPEDAHMPMVSDDTLHKVVVKVAVDPGR